MFQNKNYRRPEKIYGHTGVLIMALFTVIEKSSENIADIVVFFCWLQLDE